MRLHARQMAVTAGAEGEAVERIAAALVMEREIRVERARELLRDQKDYDLTEWEEGQGP